jgi:pyridoxamine-phosphate oxidase
MPITLLRLTIRPVLVSNPRIGYTLRHQMDIQPHSIKINTHDQYLSSTPLTPSSVHPNPLDQFHDWFAQAATKPSPDSPPAVLEPEAMTLSTSTPGGVPSSRIVLLKRVDETGFVFFTNYDSRKSRELKSNPRAAITFYWKEVHRQVRVVGRVEMVTPEESDEYYNSRPLGSRIGAWASPQSETVGEDDLQEKVDEVRKRFGIADETKDEKIPRPEFWGGWRVIPEFVSFRFRLSVC